MSQLTSLRFLINNSPPIFSPFFFNPRIFRPFKTLTFPPIFSQRRSFYYSTVKKTLIDKNKRGKSTLPDKITPEKVVEMNDNNNIGFNKRRAEGRDKSDKPKHLQLKTRKLNPVNTIAYVQILGTGMDTQDTCPSVLLFFDKQRFIFNAGEGLQRYCTEHKIKLSKIDHIFLSRVCSETAGGLPGLLLTMAGIGDEGMCVNMWGPSDLNYLVDAMKKFIPNAAMVHTKSFGPTSELDGIPTSDSNNVSKSFDLIDDEVVKISAIILQPNGNNGPVSPTTNDGLGTAIKPGDISVIYVCELPKIQGKFHPEKAKALGLQSGPKYRDLQNGQSVKSDNCEIMVHPSDVMDPPVPGPIVLLVDCPTSSHFLSLLSADTLNAYYFDHMSEAAKEVNCVIHLSPSSVSNDPDYQKWMKRFGNAQHIMAGHEKKISEIPVLKASARVATRLNYLCPQFFPASGFWSPHTELDNHSSHSNSSLEGIQGVVAAENLLKFNLRPHAILGLNRSSIPVATGPAEILDELRAEIPEIVDAVQQVKQLWDHPMNINNAASLQNSVEEPWFDEIGLPSCLENITREDMEIVLLGTGSSQPSKYRNVTSIFINLFSKGGLLFDCGEGTLGQLKRRFGVEGADDVVRSLTCIWISHIHADHHTGLARILSLRRDLLRDVPHEPLLVVGPGQLMRFLNAYQRLEELDMQFVDCRLTTHASWDYFEVCNSSSDEPSPSSSESAMDSTIFAKGSPMDSYWQRLGIPASDRVIIQRLNTLRKVLQEAGLKALISFPVRHCPQAFGVSLLAAQRADNAGKMIPGWKIVYSGDTRPCPEVRKEARGATVLIHEATFEDGLIAEAEARNHSTTKEAIEVGEAAGVYRIILTHFSQRYPKIPVFGESHMHNTCIGFDLMSINLADLPVVPQVLPHLKLLFRNEMGADEVDEIPLEEISAAA